MSQGNDTWETINEQITYQDAYNLRRSDVPTRQAAMFASGAAVQTDDPEFAPILERIRVTDSSFFDIFSVPFLYGGTWDKDIDVNPKYQLVISESLNQTLFDGKNSVGNTLYVNRKPYQVVGVMKTWNPSPKYYDVNNGAFDDAENIFAPFSLAPEEEFVSWGNNQSWKNESMNTYAERLQSETHWVQYWVELNSPAQQEAYKQWLERYVEQQKLIGRFERDDAHGEITDVAEWLEVNKVVPEDNKILVGLSALFLLVCLVNMLGLLLAKFLKRASEVGVRRAIGASRAQIFFQHMIEVGLIGLGGGVIGLLWAWATLSVLSARFDLEASLTQLDYTMWFVAPAIAVTASLIAGIYPAWRICTTNPSIYLKSQ